MSGVINLDDHRSPSTGEWDGYVCPKCGGAWFTVSAVAFALDENGGPGRALAWMAPPECVGCEENEGPVEPSRLRVTDDEGER